LIQILPKQNTNTALASSSEATRTVWFASVLLVVIATVTAAICWSLAHPYGIHWDEAEYLNELRIDAQRLRTGHIVNLGGRMLIQNIRPPAYRLLALPLISVFGFSTTGARVVSLACFVLSSLFVFLAARRISTPAAGAFAALLFASSPEVVSASMFFGTDTALYVATAAMLFYIFALWSDEEKQTNNWVGLGCAVGLGFLAKTTFILIALPVFGFWFAANQWTQWKLPPLTAQRKAAVLASLIAVPWWALNFRRAIAYGQYARAFTGNSLGSPSFATWTKWLETVVRCLLGPGLTIVIGIVLVMAIAKLLRNQLVLSDLQKAAMGACLCAALPIVAAQLAGTNHLLRHITASIIPLAIVISVLASSSGGIASWATTAISTLLLCVQTSVLLTPVLQPNHQPVYLGFPNAALPSRTMVRFDQWDWQPAVALADSCRVNVPEIGFIGGGRNFNPPQIGFPWVARAAATSDARIVVPKVTWLWRHEEGPPDWQRIMERADQADMVITAPQFTGEIADKADPDDQYNAEFEKRLLQDPLFKGPYFYPMGRFTSVEIAIFVKKDLSCPPVQSHNEN
jgi:hypothetical protein